MHDGPTKSTHNFPESHLAYFSLSFFREPLQLEPGRKTKCSLLNRVFTMAMSRFPHNVEKTHRPRLLVCHDAFQRARPVDLHAEGRRLTVLRLTVLAAIDDLSQVLVLAVVHVAELLGHVVVHLVHVLQGHGVGPAGSGFPVRAQPGSADVLLLAGLARVRALVGVQPLVQLQVHELRELGRAEVAGVRLLAAVQPQVRLEVAGAAETLLAHLALVRLFPGVHQVVLLQVRQLREVLGAHVALERAFPGVRPEVHFQVGELAEGLLADVALVVHLAVLLLQGVGERAVPALAVLRPRGPGGGDVVGVTHLVVEVVHQELGRDLSALLGRLRGSAVRGRRDTVGKRGLGLQGDPGGHERRLLGEVLSVISRTVPVHRLPFPRVSVHVEMGRGEHGRHAVDVGRRERRQRVGRAVPVHRRRSLVGGVRAPHLGAVGTAAVMGSLLVEGLGLLRGVDGARDLCVGPGRDVVRHDDADRLRDGRGAGEWEVRVYEGGCGVTARGRAPLPPLLQQEVLQDAWGWDAVLGRQ